MATAVLGGLLLVLPAPMRAAAQATRPVAAWLDTLSQWNVAGAPVPTAPPTPLPGSPITERCTARERAPQSAEEARVAAAGWRLEDYWPAQREGAIVVILATASYDGMCRPWDFNGFVFAGGRFAGTLAPAPMRSRFDGQLALTPTLITGGQIVARFLRYAPADAFCCPTLPASVVTYRVDQAGGAPLLIALRVAPEAPATQLPRTGSTAASPLSSWRVPAAVLLLLAGLACLVARPPSPGPRF